MLVFIMAIGAVIAGVGIGARWVAWMAIGTFVFIGGVAIISAISAFDVIVSFVMVVLGFVMGSQWRRRTRRWAPQPASDGLGWSSWPAWSDGGSTSSSADSFGGGDSGGAGASASWDSSGDASGDSGGSDSGGGDSGGGDSGGEDGSD